MNELILNKWIYLLRNKAEWRYKLKSWSQLHPKTPHLTTFSEYSHLLWGWARWAMMEDKVNASETPELVDMAGSVINSGQKQKGSALRGDRTLDH